MHTVNVLSTGDLDEAQLDRLRAVSSRLQVVQHTAWKSEDLPPGAWSGVEVLFTHQSLPMPGQEPSLRWVYVFSAGVNHVLGNPVLGNEVILTNASGIHAISVSEHAMALMLAWTQRLPTWFAHQRRVEWPQDLYTRYVFPELHGATVGIVGYGSIGREIGRLASGFGMRVLASKRTDDRIDRGYTIPGRGDPEGVIPERFYPPEELRTMLAESDHVVLAVPLTDATRHLIGADELRAMRPSAFLVNIARGGIVDEAALVRALQEGWIDSAGLDVFSEEPLPADSPLWHLENVTLTPHVAGLSPRYNERAVDLFVENLRRYLAGESLLNQIDYEQGY